MNTTNLIIFAKEPIPGSVKTRLGSQIGMVAAAKLYQAFIADTLNLAALAPGLCKTIAYEGNLQPESSFIVNNSTGFVLWKQRGNTLGEKLFNAFQDSNLAGFAKIVIFGTDSPDMKLSFLRDAMSSLERDDYVLGPTEDGGIYLIGAKQLSSRIFKGVQWSSPEVFQQLRQNIKASRVSFTQLPKWYDVDLLEDLKVLTNDLEVGNITFCKNTRKIIAQIDCHD